MGFIKKLFGKKSPPPQNDARGAHFAFVLLDEARLPSAEAIARSYSVFDPAGESVRESDSKNEKTCSGQDSASLVKTMGDSAC